MLKIKSDKELKKAEYSGLTAVEIPEEYLDNQHYQEQCPDGEGGTTINGILKLRCADRVRLFDEQVLQYMDSITCTECKVVVQDTTSWADHCTSEHSEIPGYSPTLLVTADTLNSDDFVKSAILPFSCHRCSRCFSSKEQREEHQSSTVRTVRLICCVCQGQYSDLEQHIQDEHSGCLICGFCGIETYQLVAHCNSLHEGFDSVLIETTSTCFGDGITSEWMETVLLTSFRFLASEVKPESVLTPEEGTLKQGLKNKLTYGKTEGVVQSKDKTSYQKLIDRYMDPSTNGLDKSKEMTIAERDKKNVEDFQRFCASGRVAERHDCDICGFIPYTTNKYREKQDHIAKVHFKERIDAVIPVSRSYECPGAGCVYKGKDRQDILRHYTGKHNILKMWVDQFLKEQSKRPPAPFVKPKRKTSVTTESGPELTFEQMQKLAIAKEMGVVPVTSKIINKDNMVLEERSKPTLLTQRKILPKILPKPCGILETVAQDLLSTPVTRTVTISTPSGQISLCRQKGSLDGASNDSFRLLPGLGGTYGGPLYLYRCDQCPGNVVFNSLKGLEDHKSQDHQVQLDSDDVVDPSDPDAVDPLDPLNSSCSKELSWNCTNCAMMFPTAKALTLHVSICTENTMNTSSLRPPSLSSSLPPPSLVTPLSDSRGGPAPSSGEGPPKKKARRPPPSLVPLSAANENIA